MIVLTWHLRAAAPTETGEMRRVAVKKLRLTGENERPTLMRYLYRLTL
jgi:hypothetical protein